MLYLPHLPTLKKRTVSLPSALLLSCSEPGPRSSVSFSFTGCTFKVASSTRNLKPAGCIYNFLGGFGAIRRYRRSSEDFSPPSDERPPFTASNSLTSETFCSAISAKSARSSEVPFSSASTDMLKSTSGHAVAGTRGQGFTNTYQYNSVYTHTH